MCTDLPSNRENDAAIPFGEIRRDFEFNDADAGP
jgi:hypothetical protein